MITLGDAHHATRLLLQARRRSDAFTAVPSALPPFRPSPCRPRLVVFLSSPSIQFDHGRFSEMRSQMGNATPAGQRDRVTQSVSQLEFTSGRGGRRRRRVPWENKQVVLFGIGLLFAREGGQSLPSEEASPLDPGRGRRILSWQQRGRTSCACMYEYIR